MSVKKFHGHSQSTNQKNFFVSIFLQFMYFYIRALSAESLYFVFFFKTTLYRVIAKKFNLLIFKGCYFLLN